MLRAALVLAAVVLVTAAAPAGAALKARGSVEQVWVTGARSGETVTLLDRRGNVVRRGKADRFGSHIFRELKPRGGYRVHSGGRRTQRFAVLKPGRDPRARVYA